VTSARTITALEIGEESAQRPLGKFGCKVDRARTIQPLPRIRVKVAKLSDNFGKGAAR
jgi:hypothetical protein